jgi:hypothetical protein
MALLLAVAFATTAVAAPKNQTETDATTAMTYTAWDPGCEHTMNTNHFDLAPGQSVEVPLDLSLCDPTQLDDLLYWGQGNRRFPCGNRVASNNVPPWGAPSVKRLTVSNIPSVIGLAED